MLNRRVSFAREYATYLMGSAVYLVAAFTLCLAGHIRASLLFNSVPAKVAKEIGIAVTLFAEVIAVYVAYVLLSFACQAYASCSISPTIDEVPLVYPHGVMALSRLLFSVRSIARAVQSLMGLPTIDAQARCVFWVE